jgi:hypothetical protein
MIDKMRSEDVISVVMLSAAVRDKAIVLALTGRNPPFPGASAKDVFAANDALAVADRTIAYTDLIARNGLGALSGDGDYSPVEEAKGAQGELQLLGGICRGPHR